ncbi:multicopper oxidase family protein [Dactylosporangium sp. NPDC048998]|uniref:multicopper oxidase family protein n=1 Tax=Dactylosporangium sp. NPDC048998 TaxID=3363976 RepID=UPI0037113535
MRPGVRLALAVILVLVLGGLAYGGYLLVRPPVSTVGHVRFDRPLRIPPLAPSTVDPKGVRTFTLEAGAGVSDFGRGRTPTWGYNGAYLGPTLRVRQGEPVQVDIHNGLKEQTTVHWHGMHLPAKADGGPFAAIRPGGTATAAWTVNQPAATLWYHPHPDGRTEEQVYRGLAGMVIVDGPGSGPDPALPSGYGVDDVPVIVQDKGFTDGGEFTIPNQLGGTLGILGDTLLVNGTIGPYHDVTTQLVRLRLLNASTARSYSFGFSDGRAFDLVGTDGGLLSAPYRTDRVAVSVGERAEIVVAMRPGERVVLRSYPPNPDSGTVVRQFQGGADAFDVLQLRAAATLKPSPPVPAKLTDVPRLDPAGAVPRTFELGGRAINGQKMAMNRVDVVAVKDVTERWTVRNTDFMQHNFHVHGTRFQIASKNGRPPPPPLSGWKDTINLQPGEEMDLLVRFVDYADPTTPYMYHCHLLKHEDSGMMGQVVVVEPGQQAQLAHHHPH